MTSASAVAASEGLALRGSMRRWGVWTAVLIACATGVRILFATTTEIANGEAYYYLWSRFPSLSYYDHPPLIAWLTWLTTRVSHGSLAIRAGPIVCSVLFALGIYRLGARLFSPRAGFIAVVIVTGLPVFFASGYVVNPEAPLAPLWVLALILLDGMREHDEAWRPLALGAVVGLAFLAKYSGVLLLGVTLLYVVLSPQGRRWLRRPVLFAGAGVALVVALPVLIWSQQRGWPSLVLHFVERAGPVDAGTLLRNGAHAIVGQLGPFHPLMFPGLLVVLVLCIRRSALDDRYRFLALASGPVLLFFLVMMSRVKDPEPHWTMVGYLPLTVAAGGLLDARAGSLSPVLRTYLVACLAISAIGAAVLYAYSQRPDLRRLLPAGAYDPDRDVFNEMTGWSELRGVVEASAAAMGPGAVVASSQYALCAHILTALDDRPTVYCPGRRRTEFDFIGRRDPPPGVPVLYIHDDHYPEDPAILLPDRVCTALRTLPVERRGVLMQNYHLYACLPASNG